MDHMATAATRRLPRLGGAPRRQSSSAPSHRRVALERLHTCYLSLLIPVKDVVSQCTVVSGGWCTKSVHGTKLQGMAGQGAGACLCAGQKLLNRTCEHRQDGGLFIALVAPRCTTAYQKHLLVWHLRKADCSALMPEVACCYAPP